MNFNISYNIKPKYNLQVWLETDETYNMFYIRVKGYHNTNFRFEVLLSKGRYFSKENIIVYPKTMNVEIFSFEMYSLQSYHISNVYVMTSTRLGTFEQLTTEKYEFCRE